MAGEVPLDPSSPCCEHKGPATAKRKRIKRPLFIVVSLTLILLAVSFFVPFLFPFRQSIVQYLKVIGWPVAVGFLLGGLIDFYIPREYISKYLSRNNKRTIFYAAGLGFLMTACSHGILALSMEIHKKGASGPAVVSFLLASPWANLPITFLLIGFFGLKGILIIVSALTVSISTGLLLQLLDRGGWIEKNKHSVLVDERFSIRKDLIKRFKNYSLSIRRLREDMRGVARGIGELADMVLWWILLGILLASLVSAFVPHTIFQNFFGPSLLGLFITLSLAAILEVCSEGTSPLAFEIYRQTGALGNAFAFLMGGVVTDYTEVGLVWMNVGKKTALWMLAIALPQVLVIGVLLNHLF